MKSFLQGMFFLCGLVFNVHAQRICGSAIYKQQMLSADPSLKEVFRNIEKQTATGGVRANGLAALRDTGANEVINVPVVIHVLYKNAEENISDAQIRSQLTVLNNDFNRLNSDSVNTPQAFKALAGNAGIRFCLAQVDPQGKRTTGIDRKHTAADFFKTDDGMKMISRGGAAAWDSKHYLNIWVCKLASSSLGYATPPGAAADLDGVVIATDVFGTTGNLRTVFNKGRTATHEIGHWLGLIHVWGDDNCGDDHVDDTPKQESYNYGCPSFPKLSACSVDNNGDMFMNFMDFSDDACMNLFTRGQVKRMRALFAQGNVRNSFLSSFACDSTLAPGPSLQVTSNPTLPSISLSAVKVYPSPVITTTTIECKEAAAMVKSLNIFNSLGVKVYTVSLSKEKTVLDLSRLVSGIYIIQVGDGRNKIITKIYKQ